MHAAETASEPAGTPPRPEFRLFEGMDAALVSGLLASMSMHEVAAGEVIVQEGEANRWLYLVEAGEIGIWRGHEHAGERLRLATLKAGDSFGEMSVLNGDPVSATLAADNAVVLRRVAWDELPDTHGVRELVARNLARVVVDRLSNANDAVLARHLERMQSMQVQLSISVFLTKTLVGLALYIFLLPLVAVVKPYLPSDSLISFFFILTYLLISMMIVRESALEPREYGVTIVGWRHAVWRGALLTLPAMALVFALKAGLVLWKPDEYALFEPGRGLGNDGAFAPGTWLAIVLVYLVLSFAQEFIRCAIQGSLSVFYRVTDVSDAWKSILVANVVFAALHTHLSNFFALIVFVPGLFWGWLYQRERSFISLAVSHALLGVWGLFVLGFPY